MTNERAIELLRRLQDEQFDGIHGDERREALEMAVRALEGDGDTIYRQDAIDACCFGITHARAINVETGEVVDLFSVSNKELHKAIERIEALPSAQPERKTGKWIKISPANIYECSKCGKNVMTDDISAYDFCHGCGARMVKEGEEHD